LLTQVLAEERMKESSLVEGKELVEVWHSDSGQQRKSRKSAGHPQTPTSGDAKNLDTGGSLAHGGAAVELVPYSGPRAGEMEKVRDAFLKVRAIACLDCFSVTMEGAALACDTHEKLVLCGYSPVARLMTTVLAHSIRLK
jgi:hypothetical protein